MNLIRKSFPRASLLATTALLFGLFQSTAQAQQSGPLAEILQRLDAFVLELESLDVQAETLENPSLEDKVLDALSIKLCGKLTGSGVLQGKLKPIKGEVEGGIGIGPNIMGTGVEVKIEPKIEGDVHLVLKTQASINTSVCIDVYKLAKVIQTEIDPPEEPQARAVTDPALVPLENFARQLDDNAKQQILQFAEYSPGDLLELMVLVLKDAGIDPTVDPASLSDGLLATVNAIGNSAVDLSPDSVLNLAQSNSLVQSLPLGTDFQDIFANALGAFSSFTLADVSPCSGIELPGGLAGLLGEICGINSLVSGIGSYLETLGRIDDSFGVAADAVAGLASEVEDEAENIEKAIASLFGDVEGIFDDIEGTICQDIGGEACAGGSIAGVGFECCASASINVCNVAAISISVGC